MATFRQRSAIGDPSLEEKTKSCSHRMAGQDVSDTLTKSKQPLTDLQVSFAFQYSRHPRNPCGSKILAGAPARMRPRMLASVGYAQLLRLTRCFPPHHATPTPTPTTTPTNIANLFAFRRVLPRRVSGISGRERRSGRKIGCEVWCRLVGVRGREETQSLGLEHPLSLSLSLYIYI